MRSFSTESKGTKNEAFWGVQKEWSEFDPTNRGNSRWCNLEINSDDPKFEGWRQIWILIPQLFAKKKHPKLLEIK